MWSSKDHTKILSLQKQVPAVLVTMSNTFMPHKSMTQEHAKFRITGNVRKKQSFLQILDSSMISTDTGQK